MPSVACANFWRTDLTRDCFLSYATKHDLQALRLVCRDFSVHVAPRLFQSISICFHTNTFSRRSRMLALERIGHHVRHVSFNMPHSADTFLPPLLAPGTRDEVTFVYEPRVPPAAARPSSSSSSSSGSLTSKYGSWEMNDLLVKQYPPLFHAATDIDGFVRAFTAMAHVRHLTISCPDQPAAQRYRKDAVDYALISLRVAVERANPLALESLSLTSVHPAAPFYLRPQLSIGASPSSSRVWHRVRRLKMEMESFAYGDDHPSDHLKILHTYLQSFSQLHHLDFRWLGAKGPCPLSLDAEPCTSRPASLDCAKACPLSSERPACKPIKFRHLKSMHLKNASLDASQAAAFVMSHRKVLQEFEYEQCHLRSGTWDDALAPLTRICGNDDWKRKQEEVMEVPLMLSPVDDKNDAECVQNALWDDEPCRKNKGLQALRKVSLRTREILPEHVRRLLRTARVAWH